MSNPSIEYPEGSDHERRAKELQEAHAAGVRARWIQIVTRPAKALGLDPERVYEQLERQGFCCPVCVPMGNEAPAELTKPHIDLDDEGRPRGLLCGWCLRYVKSIEADPLRASKLRKAPRGTPLRSRLQALRYLKVAGFEPEV